MSPDDAARARQLLCSLGDFVRDAVIHGRRAQAADELASVSRESIADTIYSIDTISEEAITEWFHEHWPAEWSVELVAEGFDDPATRVFPKGAIPGATDWLCVIDPIDGTREIMYDKRPAWVLAGIAPRRAGGSMLSDIFVSAMTEIPVRKQWQADQISAVRGQGLVSEGVNVLTGKREPIVLRPSRATDFRHGFASTAKFFPAGKATAARLEEALWEALYPGGSGIVIFDDQYISTGGVFYEVLAGHDRMQGDLRPSIVRSEGIDLALMCHPYDVCTAMLLTEAGVIFEDPEGGPVNVPLDITSPVEWIAYANESLAELARPVVRRLVQELRKT